MGKNQTCSDYLPTSGRIHGIRNENECKEAAKLIWTRCDIQFNAISNAKFPTGCYVDQAEDEPVKKDVYYNRYNDGYNIRQDASAPICRWELPLPECKLILYLKKF